MTPEQGSTLRFFKWSEFHHPELMDYSFCVFLDHVRYEYGWPIALTSDARTPTENKEAGGVTSSRHLVGQAVDIVFPLDAQHVWKLVAAIFAVAGERPIELELVHSAIDKHVHVAFLEAGKASTLIVAAD
jgi:hypothetical protein